MNIARYVLTEKERTPIIINAICKEGIRRAKSSPHGIYQYDLKETVEVVVNIANGAKVDDYYFPTMAKLRDVIDYAEIEHMKGRSEAIARAVNEEDGYNDFLKRADDIRKSIAYGLSIKQKREILKQMAPGVSWSLRNAKLFLAGVKNIVWAFGKWRRI